MLFRLRLLAIPLSLFVATACGGGGGGDDDGDPIVPDANDTIEYDADVTGVCGEFNGPATVLTSYPANFTGNVVGAGGDFDVAEGVCLDERSHFAQEGEDQVIRLDNLTPGTDYVVQIDAVSDLAFYVATDCSGSNLVAGECLLFVDEANGLEAGNFAAPDSGTVYVIVDHFGADPVEDGSYTLSVFEPDCTQDVDCSGTPSTPFCADFTCVACATSFHCDTTGAPVCDGTTNTCIAGFDVCTGDDASPPESADDGPAGATVLTPAANNPDSVAGKICSDPATELDFYSVTVAEDDSRVFSLDWTGASDDPDLDLYFFNADGDVVDTSFFDKPEVVVAANLEAGTYYIAVSKFESDGVPVAAAVDYTLTASVPECETSFDCDSPAAPVCSPALTCVAGPADCTGDTDDPNDGPAAATLLVSGVQANGAVCNTPSSESDFYRIVAAARDDLSISVAYTDNAAADLDVEVFDENGESLGFTFWLNPEVVSLSFLPAGTYYIKVTYFGAPVTVAHPYTITATTSPNVTGCTSAADCATEHSTQVFRGSCNAGTCSFIEGAGALAQDALCDSNNDCTSGQCSYSLFQAAADTSVCTIQCSATSECTTAHGAGFSCTVPYNTNFCHPDCASNLECGVNPGSDVLDSGEPWDYLTCTTGVCDLDP